MEMAGALHHSIPHDIKEPDELKPAGEELSQTDCAALEKIVWQKLDIWLLPLCTISFLLSLLDRTNIANARIAGLQKSLDISNYQYTIAITVTYLPYLAVNLPSNLLLKRVGADIMLPSMITLWGVVSASQGLVSNYSGLIACRFFLGLLEGGLFPGIILHLSCFYPPKRLQVRIASFFVSASLAGAFSGLLAAVIDQINTGGKPGWTWIFILEGLFTFVFGVITFFLLPRSPQTARFLTENERAYVISALKKVGSVSEDDDKDSFTWAEVVRTVKSPHVWFLGVSVFFNGGAILFGLVYFGPTIVASLGYAGNRAQLMSVPPLAASFVLSLISSVISDRYQCRGYTAISCSLLQVIGFSIFYASTSRHIRYASLFFCIPGANSSMPASLTWMANNSAPHTRRATAVAVSVITAQPGGILATWLLGVLSPAPNYTSAAITFIAMSVGMVIFSIVNLAFLQRENRLKAERRARMKKEEEPEGLGDRSAWFIYNL